MVLQVQLDPNVSDSMRFLAISSMFSVGRFNMVLTSEETALTEDRNAGKAMSRTLRTPMPPVLIGNEAKVHVLSSKFEFVSNL